MSCVLFISIIVLGLMTKGIHVHTAELRAMVASGGRSSAELQAIEQQTPEVPVSSRGSGSVPASRRASLLERHQVGGCGRRQASGSRRGRLF